MPITKSAKKRLKQSLVRRSRNRATKSILRGEVRKVTESLTAGDAAKAETEFRTLCKLFDRAAARRVIHPNLAARTKSRLSARIKAAKGGAAGTKAPAAKAKAAKEPAAKKKKAKVEG
jgi:small subunit ribosomal protein S20